MGNTERRARSFKTSLEAAGYSVVWKPKKSAVPWATAGALPDEVVGALMSVFRELGGVSGPPELTPQGWDMQADDVLIEFDEDLHFNRYRTLVLAAPWYSHLPWSEAYSDYALSFEDICLRAGRHGGKWASLSSDRMFGGSDDEGVFGERGPSRWKQRAVYDALKDAYACYSPGVALARVSIHDDVNGLNINWATKRDITLEPTALRAFIQSRTIPADVMFSS